MGSTAAQLLVQRIQSPDGPYQQQVWFEPELIVRESTMAINKTPRSPRGKH
jgi:LacI family transcriptional regulator